MPYVYEPTPEAVAQVRADLEPFIHDPASYWHEIAERLLNWLLELEEFHRSECQLEECLTCLQVAKMRVILDGHDAIQPSGCSCDEHRTYPRPPKAEGAEQ